MSVLGLLPPPVAKRLPFRFWERIFLTCRSWLWHWEQRWLPDRDSDQNSSVGCHKFNFHPLSNNYLAGKWWGGWGRELARTRRFPFTGYLPACHKSIYWHLENENKWTINWTWEWERLNKLNRVQSYPDSGEPLAMTVDCASKKSTCLEQHGLSERSQLIRPQTKEVTEQAQMNRP